MFATDPSFVEFRLKRHFTQSLLFVAVTMTALVLLPAGGHKIAPVSPVRRLPRSGRGTCRGAKENDPHAVFFLTPAVLSGTPWTILQRTQDLQSASHSRPNQRPAIRVFRAASGLVLSPLFATHFQKKRRLCSRRPFFFQWFSRCRWWRSRLPPRGLWHSKTRASSGRRQKPGEA